MEKAYRIHLTDQMIFIKHQVWVWARVANRFCPIDT